MGQGLRTLTASSSALQWYKPHIRSCFRSEVIHGFYRANSTWTDYSLLALALSVQHNFRHTCQNALVMKTNTDTRAYKEHYPAH